MVYLLGLRDVRAEAIWGLRGRGYHSAGANSVMEEWGDACAGDGEAIDF